MIDEICYVNLLLLRFGLQIRTFHNLEPNMKYTSLINCYFDGRFLISGWYFFFSHGLGVYRFKSIHNWQFKPQGVLSVPGWNAYGVSCLSYKIFCYTLLSLLEVDKCEPFYLWLWRVVSFFYFKRVK